MKSSDESTKVAWETALINIAVRADLVDSAGHWPHANISDLKRAAATSWAVNRNFSSNHMSVVELHRRYEQVAARCLTTALIWTQRDAAVGLLQSAPESELAVSVLKRLATGKDWITIGISQLTTSTQHKQAPVKATPSAAGWVISGRIPWVTGASHSRWVVVGAKTADQREVLLLLDRMRQGVEVEAPPAMAALNGSLSAPVILRRVHVGNEHLLLGPIPHVLAARQSTRAFSLTPCVLPLGVAAGAIGYARKLLEGRTASCRSSVKRMQAQYQALARQIYRCGRDKAVSSAIAADFRAQANMLAIRSSLGACPSNRPQFFQSAG